MEMNERIHRLLHHEATPGILLVIAALLAMLAENSPAKWLYDALMGTPVAVQIGHLEVDQRRPDGDLLLHDRPGTQARDPRG
jgi:NhaA family Na+:H+ antiporter